MHIIDGQDNQFDAIVVGALFDSKAELKQACQIAATHGNFEYSIGKSDRTRLTLKSASEECLWYMHTSKIGDSRRDISNNVFEIKTMTAKHKFLGIQHLGHCQATAIFISHEIQEKASRSIFVPS